MAYADRAECDFTQPFTRFTKPIMCQHCGQYTTTPHWVTKEHGRSTQQYAFCNQEHADDFYLNRLRGSGL